MNSTQKLLDETSWQILMILQKEGRIPFKELGKRVGLSAPAAAERVRKLEEVGIIIGYQAKLDLVQLELPVVAFITIKTFGEGCSRIRSLLQECPEVLSCYRVAGNDHYLAKVAAISVSHLEKIVDRFIPYATVTTSIVLSIPVAERTISTAIFPETP